MLTLAVESYRNLTGMRWHSVSGNRTPSDFTGVSSANMNIQVAFTFVGAGSAKCKTSGIRSQFGSFGISVDAFHIK